MHPDIIYGEGVVLHPDFPASEPIAVNLQSSFGKNFGVLFQENHGGWFSRPISSSELLQYYSTHTSYTTDHSILFQTDTSINTILPGSLPYKLIRYASQVVEHSNGIYDEMAYALHDHNTVSSCSLHSASPPTVLDCLTDVAENDSRTIIQPLRRYKPTAIPLDIV